MDEGRRDATTTATNPDPATQVELVILESGGNWSGWSRRSSRSPSTLRSLVQQSDEAPTVFTSRVRQALERIDARGESIQRITLVTGDALGPEVVGARFVMVLALGLQLRANGHGCLRIETSTDDPAVRRSVASIALFAASEVGEATVEVVDASASESDLECVA